MTLIRVSFSDFEWDEFNTQKVIRRVSAFELEQFFDQQLLTRLDTRRNYGEFRWIAMGIVSERIVVVVYTIRIREAKTILRIISARHVHRGSREERLYYEIKEKFGKTTS